MLGEILDRCIEPILRTVLQSVRLLRQYDEVDVLSRCCECREHLDRRGEQRIDSAGAVDEQPIVLRLDLNDFHLWFA